MGLKVTRTANPARPERRSLRSLGKSGRDMSSLISARNLYRAVAIDTAENKDFTIVEVKPDDEGHLDSEMTVSLFNRVWEMVRGNRDLDVLLDMSHIHSVDNRFVRELVFLRRHLRRQGRQLQLSNVRSECSNLSDVR